MVAQSPYYLEKHTVDFSWVWDGLTELGTDGCWKWNGKHDFRNRPVSERRDLIEKEIHRIVAFLTSGDTVDTQKVWKYLTTGKKAGYGVFGRPIVQDCGNPWCVNPKHFHFRSSK